MNLQLANVISDISSVTGQAIIKAILNGERDPRELAAYRYRRVQASVEEIARSLEGNWQTDLLFVLRQEHAGYEFCQKQMAGCDRQLEQYLQQMGDRSQGATSRAEKRKSRLRKKIGKNAPGFDVRALLFRVTGVDLPQIDGIEVMTAMTIFSEVGWDLSKWRTENHFVSWLKLCPNNKISGGRVIGKDCTPTMSASALRLSNSYLGAQFRRFRIRLATSTQAFGTATAGPVSTPSAVSS